MRKKQTKKIYDYYGAAGVIDKVEDYLFHERLLLVGEDGANLLSRAKNNAFFAEGKFWVNNHAHILDSADKDILEYVAHVINSYDLEPYITGSAQPKLSQDNLNRIPIPLPPKDEQSRILSAITTSFGLIDRMSVSIDDLSSYIKDVKSKILELAMQGKLVPQDPTDESGADMLKRINPNAKIITDTPHYPKLPDNWVLTDIQSVSNYGKCYSIDVDDINENDWILELEDIEKDTGIILWKKRKGDREVNGVRHIFKSGDILYSKLRTYLNKVLIAPNSGYCSTEIIPIKCHDSVTSQYLCAWLRSPYFLAYTQSCGYGVKMPRLNTADARNGIVPLPPLNEQRRIMEQINSIFKALDSISNSVKFP